jgi:DNA-binding protein HU-beta
MTKLMSKSELVQKVADQHSLSKKDVKGVIESLASVGYKELKKNGAFLLPGFAKFVVIKTPRKNALASIRSRKSQQCSRLSRPERLSGPVR